MDPVPRILCHRIQSTLTIDGSLDKDGWRRAQRASLRLFSGEPPIYNTTVGALWNDDDLYIGFQCDDPEPVGTMTRRDDPLFNDGNVVELFVDPAGEGETFFEFEVNPLGTLMDLFFDRLDRDWRDAVRWDADGIRTAVQIQHDPATAAPAGWTVELAIPFKNFHTAAHPPRPGHTWRCNFFRYNTVSTLPGDRLELSAWSPTFEKRFDLPQRFGHLQFAG
jgi:hypothetical protein